MAITTGYSTNCNLPIVVSHIPPETTKIHQKGVFSDEHATEKLCYIRSIIKLSLINIFYFSSHRHVHCVPMTQQLERRKCTRFGFARFVYLGRLGPGVIQPDN